jgi:cyclin-dependent kinase regulatory subunit CKS1
MGHFFSIMLSPLPRSFMSQGLPSLSLNPLLHFAEPSTFFEPFVIPLPSQTTPIDIPQEVLTRCREDFWYGNIGADNVFEYRSVEVPFEIAICLPNRNLTDNECRSIGITQSRGWVNFFRQNAERNILLFRRPRTDVSETHVTTRLVEELRSGLDWCSSLLSQQVQDGTSLLIFPMTAFDIPAPVWPGRGEELYITSGKQLIENQKEIFQFALYGSGFN